MQLTNPFEAPGLWYKANLHTHTTTSDGDTSIDDRVRQYRDQRYQVLAITDHGATNDVSALSTDDFLVISGMECHPQAPHGADLYHFVCLNVPHGFAIPEGSDANTQIRLVKEAGGEVILAHPYWCGHNLTHLLPLEGHIGIEVYNATCSRIGKAYSSVHWDDLLAAGEFVPASACDDTHHGRDIFMGWTMVKCESLTVESVLNALRRGSYYATCGPTITDFRMVDGKVTLQCSPATEVHFLCARSSGTSVYADDGDPIVCAEFAPNLSRQYVRAEIVDARGRRAWTNPIALEPPPTDE